MRKVSWLVVCLVVGLMSGVLSIAREVLGFWMPQKFPESRLLSASMVAACAISFGLAWWIENREKRTLQSEKTDLERKLEDRCPRIALDVLPMAGADWSTFEHTVSPPLFYLHHYGGDGARDVRVGPIESPSGRRVLTFDPANLVNGQVRVPVPFFVCTRERSGSLRKHERAQMVNPLLYFFLADNPEKSEPIKYVVPIEFQWDGRIIHRECELHYDTEAKKLSIHQPRQHQP